MQSGVPGAALVAALALCACRGDAAMNDGAPGTAAPGPDAAVEPGSSQPLIWQGARRLNLLCVVSGNVDGEALRAQICERLQALAANGAPIPVAIVAPGDPAVLEPQDVTLLVHGAVEGDGAERMLAFSIRPYRAAGVETDVLFGAAPRALRLSQSGTAPAALDVALAAALAETLPWLARPAVLRRIS
ncbi:MAG TPA: hypothetical protein VEW25_14155 [Allosphingosinicella sp.]|nr:hypothetical protein [Allosphingosinicella sp.]